MESLIVYTDGACSGNPGPGGWAYVIVNSSSHDVEASGGEEVTTNNRMELIAVISALKAVTGTARSVEIRTDSQYVKNGITTWIKNWKRNGWKTAGKEPVKNRELWVALDDLAAASGAKFVWVEGHSGERYNERCDELARAEIAKLRGKV